MTNGIATNPSNVNAAKAALVERVNQIKDKQSNVELANFCTWFDGWLMGHHAEYSIAEKANAANAILTEEPARSIFTAQQALKAQMERSILIAQNKQTTSIGDKHLDLIDKCLDKSGVTGQASATRSLEEELDLFGCLIQDAYRAAGTGQGAGKIFQDTLIASLKHSSTAFSQAGIKAIKEEIGSAQSKVKVIEAFNLGGHGMLGLVDPNDASIKELKSNFDNGDFSAINQQVQKEVRDMLIQLGSDLKAAGNNAESRDKLLKLNATQLNSPQKKAYYAHLTSEYQKANQLGLNPEMATALLCKSLPGILFGLAVGSFFGVGTMGAIFGAIVHLFGDTSQADTKPGREPAPGRRDRAPAKTSAA